jgi:hypothetical protein
MDGYSDLDCAACAENGLSFAAEAGQRGESNRVRGLRMETETEAQNDRRQAIFVIDWQEAF